MNTTHTAALLATALAVPFTANEAVAAANNIMGRYTRAYLRSLLIARRVMRRNLRQAIAGGHYLQASEQATLVHSFGVQAVLLIRAHSRNNKRTH